MTPLHRLAAVPGEYLAKAMALAEEGDADAAQQVCAAAIALGERSPDAYLALGNFYRGKSRFADAAAQYAKGLDLHPEHRDLREAREQAIEAAEKTQPADIRSLGPLPRTTLQAIALALVMFLAGVAIAPGFGTLRRRELNPSPKTEKLVSDLSSVLAGEPSLHDSQLKVSQSDGGITVSGTVPTDVHRSLVTAIAKHVVPDGVVLKLSLVLPKKAEVPQIQTYLVKPGDRLASLAAEWYGDASLWTKILDANRDRVSTPDRLKVGQELVRPQ